MQSPKSNLIVCQAYIYSVNNLSLKKAQTRVIAFVAFLILLFLSGGSPIVQAQSPDTLNADISGTAVYVTVVQPADGKILIGGEFTRVLGVERNNIARLNADGTLDTAFNPNAVSGAVFSIAVQADGKVLAGGYFTNIGGQPRNRIARLDAVTGAADDFNPNVVDNNPDPLTDEAILSIRVQTDGKIIAGGFFTNVGGQPRNNIARLDPTTGAADSFNPNANSDVRSIALQADGKIIIGGVFDMVGGQPRNKIARLNSDGTLDTGFDPNANDTVLSIAVQEDGKILVGGDFTSIGGQVRNSIARLDAVTGLADTAFNPDANNSVLSIVVQVDGKILVGGFFTNIGGQTQNFVARLVSTTGAADSFNPAANNVVYTIALQANGKILAGGIFTTIGGQQRNLFAQLTNDFAPTPATAIITGRVMVRGRGLARAYVTISDSNGLIQRTMTNPQGFYRFENVQTGSTYIFDVVSKRYTFTTQLIPVSENISNLNFTAR